MDFREKMSKRQDANFRLLEGIKKLVEMFPDQRFGQILYNYVLPQGDPFYEESVDTEERLKLKLEELEVFMNKK